MLFRRNISQQRCVEHLTANSYDGQAIRAELMDLCVLCFYSIPRGLEVLHVPVEVFVVFLVAALIHKLE
jgi:hypothetical protein